MWLRYLLLAVLSSTALGKSKQSDLAEATLLRVSRNHRREIRQCYESFISNKGRPPGRASALFHVTTEGQVVDFQMFQVVEQMPLQRCLQTAISKWQFPTMTMPQNTTMQLNLKWNHKKRSLSFSTPKSELVQRQIARQKPKPKPKKKK